MNPSLQDVLLSITNDDVSIDELAFAGWTCLWFAKIFGARYELEACAETGCLDSGLI